MNDIRLYGAMDEDGLRAEIEQLNKESGRYEGYNVFAQSDQGKFLITDMKQRRDFIRRQYRTIDPIEPESRFLLAALQTKEEEISGWISRLTAYKDAPAVIAEKIDALLKIIESKKVLKTSGNQYIATEIKKEMEA